MCSLRDGSHALADAFGYNSWNAHTAAVIEHLHRIPVLDAAPMGIFRVYPHAGLFHFFLPFVVVMDGMAAPKGVPADELKRIFFPQAVLRSFGTGCIAGDRHDRRILIDIALIALIE